MSQDFNQYVEDLTDGYIDALYFLNEDDEYFSPLDEEEKATIKAECGDFCKQTWHIIKDMDMSADQIGHDFYLSRHGGEGFMGMDYLPHQKKDLMTVVRTFKPPAF